MAKLKASTKSISDVVGGWSQIDIHLLSVQKHVWKRPEDAAESLQFGRGCTYGSGCQETPDHWEVLQGTPSTTQWSIYLIIYYWGDGEFRPSVNFIYINIIGAEKR